MAVGQSLVRALSGTCIRVRVGAMRPANCPSDSLVGSCLGIDVAIKEVLPSNEYDVAKYFEREWRLLKYVLILSHFTLDQQCIESWHPSVVLYLGLSRAPEPDGRIFIISEFIENGERCLPVIFILSYTPLRQSSPIHS